MSAIIEVVGVITGSAKSAYDLLNTINNKLDSDILSIIDSFDIQNKLDVYRLLILEFPDTSSDAIKNCLVGVKDVIVEIESKLKEIKEKVEAEKSWWLSKIKSYFLLKDIRNLERLIKKLDSRIESLKTISQISRLFLLTGCN